MNIYTAHYRYSGDDRLDITVKANTPPGDILAPTWDMVKGYKDGTLTQWEYAVKYFALILSRSMQNQPAFNTTFSAIVTNRQQLTLVCFCPVGQFCHRILAARMLENMGHGKYVGERQL